MSFDRQSARLLWCGIVLAPLVAAFIAGMAWEQWHSDVWERAACVRRYCPHSPAEDAFYTGIQGVIALVVAAMMALKALATPILPRSSLTKAARAICLTSFLVAGFAFLARAWALTAIA